MARAMLSLMRTFGWSNATAEAYHRLIAGPCRHDWGLGPPPPDAAVDRAREGAAISFLRSDCEVLVFVDADVAWASNEDIEYLVDRAMEYEGVVGGMVSKKTVGHGWGGRFTDGVPHELYSDERVLLDASTNNRYGFVGSAFMAIHRSVFTAMIKSGMPWCPLQQVWPFFNPMIMENEEAGYPEKITEDWAICEYARQAGKPVYALMKPVTFHSGSMMYTALDGAPPLEVEA